MHTEQSLQTLKLAGLKSLCKQLGVPNYSKLNKSALILKIVQSQQVNNDDAAATNKTTQNVPQADDGRSRHSPDKGKAKRQSSSSNLLTTSPSKKCKSKKADQGQIASETHQLESGAIVQDNESDSPAQTSSTPGQASADEKAKATRITTAAPIITLPHLHSPTHIPSTHRTADHDKETYVFAHPLSTSKSPSRSTGKPKLTPLLAVKLGQSSFKPPQPIKRPTVEENSVVSVAPVPRCSFDDLKTSSQRISYIRDSWINSMFAHLNATRSTPIENPPFPGSISLPKNSPTRNLAFQGIHPDLYDTADSKAFEVAVRFWISRLYTLMFLGNGEAWSVLGGGRGMVGPDLAKWDTITTCTQVSQDVWLVVTEGTHENSGGIGGIEKNFSRTGYLVLSLNGEVLSTDRTQIPKNDQDHQEEGGLLIHGCPIRADWHAAMNSGLDGQASSQSELLDRVKTKNSSDYPQGISRAWLFRLQSQDNPASIESINVARRAILSSCAANSFCGSKMSATAMDAEQLGHTIPVTKTSSSHLELYLADAHPLHPALAIVHRQNGFSDYVLSETGQVVGEENAGVSELWQGLLGCDEKGRETSNRSMDFWRGWEERSLMQ
ncbi:hypothetical protein IAT40_003026 [Kwoniella sp. CBS 6097]